MMRRDLSKFTGAGYDKGRGLLWQVAWFATSNMVFKKWWLPGRFRPPILRAFGATVGDGCLIREGVTVHWPWKLTLGENVWVGVEAYLLNLEPIEVGSNVCISQRSLVCTGNHDWNSLSLEFRNQPIAIKDGAWIGATAFVAPGSVIETNEVVRAGSGRSRPDTEESVDRGSKDHLESTA